ncbi:MAG: transcription termination/antitermination protein NusA [Firmicutes bacterium]|nr:transcription termination/antitermination protein NusA [Bacillota bacterium]
MNHDFMLALEAIEKEKGIKKETLFEAIEAALISAYKRNFNSAHNVEVNIERETGQIQIYTCLNVVDEVSNAQFEIQLDEARKRDPGYEIGDIVEVEVTPKNFGRIAAQTAKQVVIQRIREAERDLIYEEYVDREEDIITGSVQRFEHKNAIINLGKTEAILTPAEQMPREVYRQGDRLKIYVLEVKKTTKGPQILVSRTHPGLLKRLFELEVPEVFDGIVEIKSIAREPGNRAKIAVSSREKDVDPVGACVGPKGSRVQSIVSELKGEKIDIIEWEEDPEVFVARALNPAKTLKVELDPDHRAAVAIVPDYQLSLAIGREGQNVRLAARLTGWKIDIVSESEYIEGKKEQGSKTPDVADAVGANTIAEESDVLAEEPATVLEEIVSGEPTATGEEPVSIEEEPHLAVEDSVTGEDDALPAVVNAGEDENGIEAVDAVSTSGNDEETEETAALEEKFLDDPETTVSEEAKDISKAGQEQEEEAGNSSETGEQEP